MARRISRRPRVVWLPPDRFNRLGLNSATGATLPTQQALGTRQSILIPGGAGNAHTEVIAAVADTPVNPALAGAVDSLADLEQSAYRLRRIVGKFFCRLDQVELTQGSTSAVAVTAGFIVLRVDNVGNPLNQVTEDYSTQSIGNTADPWIWRRTWALTNIPQAVAPPGKAIFMEANTAAGSVLDGPHVDAKTARVIGPEERLFLVVSGVSMDGDNDQIGNSLDIWWDLRVLASMRSSQGNRRNASR